MIIDQADFFGKETRLCAYMSGLVGQDSPDFSGVPRYSTICTTAAISSLLSENSGGER